MESFDNHLYYDVSRVTKKLCFMGLAISWIVGVGGLAAGIFMICKYTPYSSMADGGIVFFTHRYLGETLSLGSNFVVTACSEIAGYVHATSLRWALQEEGRLTFNSNLRLFTATKDSKMNAWYTNASYLLFLVVSYSASGFLFISLLPSKDDPNTIAVLINGYAATLLCIAILGQTLISTVIIYNPGRIHSWSPSVFDTVAACLSTGKLGRQPDRCMQPVHVESLGSTARQPQAKQQSAFRAHKEVRMVFRLMWIPVVLVFPWSGTVYALVKSLRLGTSEGSNVQVIVGDNWNFFPVMNTNSTMGRVVEASDTPSISFWFGKGDRFILRGCGWTFLISAAIQSAITIGLHCAELLVNTTRDETSWRKTASKHGLRRSNALVSMLKSRTAVTLFVLKAVIHWLYTLAVRIWWTGLTMCPPQIMYLGAGLVELALFVTFCAFWSPSGHQPAAFGHLQTMADLIDWWPREHEGMFWGEKQEIRGIPHAGTDRDPLGAVNASKAYE